MANYTINAASIEQTVFASREYKLKSKSLAIYYADLIVGRRKEDLLEDFDNHPITQEIAAGPGASNTSHTLYGVGNLFSFIGFNKGDSPTKQLRHLLESIHYEEPVFRNGTWVFTIPIPDAKSIIAATPIPWLNGAGWALEVEKGISGLGHYLNKKSTRSRSGAGLQVENEVRKVPESVRTPYISTMLDDFRVNVNRFNIK